MVQGSKTLTAARAPIRVAFTLIPSRSWVGGFNYQCNLFTALNAYCPSDITPVVFAGHSEDAADIAAVGKIPGVELAQSAAFDRRLGGLSMVLLLGLDYPAAGQFRARRVNVVFETARFFGWRLRYPAVAWFPDFQHRRLPQLFSKIARWRRDIGFRAQIAAGRFIMLSSESAFLDLQKFYPRSARRASVVRFATRPSPELLAADPLVVRQKYQLPVRYFYLPNQFWRHKNHQVVVDALGILAKRGDGVVVAASGSKEDPREPGYFDALMREVRERGLENNFRYLGMIPLADVYALLRAATALINPSRFEGWSTTVEEAKSFGVPMILSNIHVHREQAGGGALYFDEGDAMTLADLLSRTARNPLAENARNLLPDLDRRVAAFAEDFVETIRRACMPA